MEKDQEEQVENYHTPETVLVFLFITIRGLTDNTPVRPLALPSRNVEGTLRTGPP